MSKRVENLMLQAGGVTTRYGAATRWGPDPANSGTYLIKISNKHADEDAMFDVVRSAGPHSDACSQ